MNQWRLGHRPALDGLRGLAILAVLLAHFDNPTGNMFSGAGAVGVTVFFTLSGFLITALLLGERASTGRVSLSAFYRRRAFRLLPALYATLFVVLLIQGAGHPMGVHPELALSVLLSVSNWWSIQHAFNNSLSHTWSLGIEEQFYLLWPALTLLGLRWGRRGVGIIASAGLVVSAVAIMLPGAHVENGSVERASSLLAGCLLATWATGQQERSSRPWVAGVALACLVPLFFTFQAVPSRVYPLLVPVVTVVVLWAVSFGEGPAWLSGRVLRWFGRRSYGIYLWHYPVIFAIPASQPWQLVQGFRLVVALVVAELSWQLIEAPCQRFARRRRDARATMVLLDAGQGEVVGDLRASENGGVERHLVDHTAEKLI